MLEAVGSGGNVVVVAVAAVDTPPLVPAGNVVVVVVGKRDVTPPTVSTGGDVVLVNDAVADAAEATTIPTGLRGGAFVVFAFFAGGSSTSSFSSVTASASAAET
mmetsp:Transcript_27919/g.50564  ORF Transcript_27919/g.50564 Transcript_27919/m.50564 type:complete len:104 (-) Transcript_27919:27-338(-)